MLQCTILSVEADQWVEVETQSRLGQGVLMNGGQSSNWLELSNIE